MSGCRPRAPFLPAEAGKFDHVRNGPWPYCASAGLIGERSFGKHTRLMPHPSRRQPRYWPYVRRALVGAVDFTTSTVPQHQEAIQQPEG